MRAIAGKDDFWEIIEEPTGFSVEKNGRIVCYDRETVEEAVAVCKKGGAKAIALREMPKSKKDAEEKPKSRGIKGRPQFSRVRSR